MIGNLKTEKEIMAQWKGNSTEPLVSICCLAYNHGGYIEDALKGFLIQSTNFPFEILIHDDASIDRTADIIREYESAYPDIIKPIYQTVNQYSLGVKPISIFNFRRAQGKYIAMCEGDDYWTDPLKIQKQIDFLEARSDYVLSFHDVRCVDHEGNMLQLSKIKDKYKRDYSAKELMEGMGVQTLTLCFRNIPEITQHILSGALNGDAVLTSRLGEFGKGKYQHDIEPGMYRYHPGGIWSMTSDIQKLKNSSITAHLLQEFHKDKGYLDVSEVWYHKYLDFRASILAKGFKIGRFKVFIWVMKYGFKENGWHSIKDFLIMTNFLVKKVIIKFL